MSQLFTVSTDRMRLSWYEVRRDAGPPRPRPAHQAGTLRVRVSRPGALDTLEVWRADPPDKASGARVEHGPLLFEQRDYRLLVKGIGGREVAVGHRDPNIVNRFDDEDGDRVDGLVNFGSQIGISTFEIIVDGKPELELDVEVFPTKLDYKSDYEQILADVQETLRTLAFEYLRATWRGASAVQAPSTTKLEWLVLLRSVVDTLERALRQVALRPVRGLRRDAEVRRPEQIRRVDGALRNELRRHAQRGVGDELMPGVRVPSRLTERRAQPTLDTPEHRWLATQVERIRRRLAELIIEEGRERRTPRSARGDEILGELRRLEGRVSQWTRLEPLQAADGPPPVGFASLQLLGAPGYREAYQACITLSLGLRIEGGPLQLSVKDLNVLYEYWCYLALLKIVGEETGAAIDPRALLAVRDRGLSVTLRQGHESKVDFELAQGRRLTVRYNPALKKGALVPQRPDILLTLQQPDWPAVHLVLDAKYRVDTSAEYRARYQSAGPPEDALNAMHRYRDAILEDVGGTARRSVVQAAALFPACEDAEVYEAGRLWGALGGIGVGAIPLLPGRDHFLRAWLRRWLGHGGWEVSDQAIDHLAIRRAAEWRRAASEPVLIGALRGEDPGQHLAWIREQRRYYTPLAKGQARLFAAAAVAFYEPARLVEEEGRGAVRSWAPVLGVRIARRSEIATPWATKRGDGELVLYELGPVEAIAQPITTDEGLRGRPIVARRWSSRLALARARRLSELFLESEPEWRLYEELEARAVSFELRPKAAKLRGEDELQGRVEFVVLSETTVTWRGSAGFVIRGRDGREVITATARGVLDHLGLGTPGAVDLGPRSRDDRVVNKHRPDVSTEANRDE